MNDAAALAERCKRAARRLAPFPAVAALVDTVREVLTRCIDVDVPLPAGVAEQVAQLEALASSIRARVDHPRARRRTRGGRRHGR